MPNPNDARMASERTREQGFGTALLERPVEAATDLLKEQAKERFLERYAKQEERSSIMARLNEEFAMEELNLAQDAKDAGEIYIPYSMAIEEVMKAGVEDRQPENPVRIDVVEVKQDAEHQNHLPTNLGQVVIDATRTYDDISTKAFANTAPDERKHRRVSTYEPVAATQASSVELVTEEIGEKPIDVFEIPVQPEQSSAEDAIEEAEAREFATFEDYVANTKKKGPVEGVYQKAGKYHDAKTGNFASNEAVQKYMDTPVESPVSHYDKVNDIDNKDTVFKEPDYSGMTIVELAREAGKVEYRNPGDEKNIDPELTKIREIAKAKYLEIAKISGDKDALEHYEESMEDFDSMSGIYTMSLHDKEPQVESVGLKEKAKAWWGKNKEKFGVAYWAAKWSTTYNGWLDKGTNENMDSDEVDKIRNKNRTKFIIGSVGLSIAAGVSVGLAVHEALSSDAVSAATGGVPGEGLVAGPPYPSEIPAVDSGFVQITPELPPTIPSIDISAFNVQSGMGGEELFAGFNLTPSDWAGHENALLQMAPDNFYPMDTGGIGLRPGMLPQNVQDYINSIRS